MHPYACYAILHRTSIIETLWDHQTPSVFLVLAIGAAGARFERSAVPSNVVSGWVHQTMCLLMRDSIHPSLISIQAAVILCAYFQASASCAQASIMCAYATRQAVALKLHRAETWDKTRYTFIEDEERRRAFFACYCLERMMSDDTPESVSCPADRIIIRLPCDGFNYRMSIQTELPVLILEGQDLERPSWIYENVGMLGHYVRLCGIRFQVVR